MPNHQQDSKNHANVQLAVCVLIMLMSHAREVTTLERLVTRIVTTPAGEVGGKVHMGGKGACYQHVQSSHLLRYGNRVT